MPTNDPISLKKYNTFGIDVKAKDFLPIHSIDQLSKLDSNTRKKGLILGGGSNILFTKPINQTVLYNQLKGFKYYDFGPNHVLLEAHSGEVWHTLVTDSVQKGYGGLENMALIPGTAGAAPIQNIGAYGKELKDVFHSLEFMHLEDGKIETFTLADCQFGYRNSIFKNKLKGKYFITKVRLILSKESHDVNISYGALKDTLPASASIQDIYNAVIQIRKSKLPDPEVIGNGGSFFKNPAIPIGQYQQIKQYYPDMPHYPINNKTVKVPAGWLIDKAGWKGIKRNDAGVHEKQALVLVNYGNARGQEILRLASDIQKDIFQKFRIRLQAEVNIY